MICKELMKTQVECVTQDEAVEVAARKMRDANIGFLPVCDRQMKVLGTLTDRDIAIRVVAERLPIATKVQEVMSKEVVSCRPEDDIRRAEELMGQKQKSRILCLDANGKLAGVISLSDIAQREEASRTARIMREVTGREARVH